jgi:hypothetical protein
MSVINFQEIKDDIILSRNEYELCAAKIRSTISELDNHRDLPEIDRVVYYLKSSLLKIDPWLDQDEWEEE